MNDGVLVFTFSPVQPFIAEARRAVDLLAGSTILARLAGAVIGEAQNHGTVIYPAAGTPDAPNRVVALVPWPRVDTVAQAMQQALHREWSRIAEDARHRLNGLGLPVDRVWEQIWDRQVGHLWETFWVAVELESRSYAKAYRDLERAIGAVKRTRPFDQIAEEGPKDSLSGRRTALRTSDMDPWTYWTEAARRAGVPRLRPAGRERLDAIGAIKRFADLGLGVDFILSTSSVASANFLREARPHLGPYRSAVESLLGNQLYRVRNDLEWPYDGDLFYLETLTKDRLEDSYGAAGLDPGSLKGLREALQKLYRSLGTRPSPYYAVIAFDGDDMGQRVAECLDMPNPEAAHSELSKALSSFASAVPGIVREHGGVPVYAGGDDLMALAPLSAAVPLSCRLAATFRGRTGGTASAGLAISHHLYPLGAAIRASREVVQYAKKVEGKASLAVHVLRRSGEFVTMRSHWDGLDRAFGDLVSAFQNGELASRFAYDAAVIAGTLVNPDERFASLLRRSLARHSTLSAGEDQRRRLEGLLAWTRAALPGGSQELARWLMFARFVSQRGGE